MLFKITKSINFFKRSKITKNAKAFLDNKPSIDSFSLTLAAAANAAAISGPGLGVVVTGQVGQAQLHAKMKTVPGSLLTVPGPPHT